MAFIDSSGGGLNRRNDSPGVIYHAVVLIAWPSFDPVLPNQRCFRVSTALILLIYFSTRTWSGKIRLLVFIGIALLAVGFRKLLCLFKTDSMDLIKCGSIQLTDRV